MLPNVCNDSEDGIITVHIHFNSERQWVIILWKEINGFELDVPIFSPLRAVIVYASLISISWGIQRDKKTSCVFHKVQWVLFCSTISTFPPPQQSELVMGMSASTDSLVFLCLLQIIVFMCYGIMLNKWVLQTYQPDFMKSPLVYHPGHRAQVWRFFSYMFMHVGYDPPLTTCWFLQNWFS